MCSISWTFLNISQDFHEHFQKEHFSPHRYWNNWAKVVQLSYGHQLLVARSEKVPHPYLFLDMNWKNDSQQLLIHGRFGLAHLSSWVGIQSLPEPSPMPFSSWGLVCTSSGPCFSGPPCSDPFGEWDILCLPLGFEPASPSTCLLEFPVVPDSIFAFWSFPLCLTFLCSFCLTEACTPARN